MNMVTFAIIMPLIVLVILGFIYGTKPTAYGVEYTFMEQSFGLEHFVRFQSVLEV